ncbi:MAG: Single-stranded-DNA-specific exonuclease RecJ [Candidatus Moranbacteria bacterium GW2011_GWC2_37_73]|nr:MAG: single-stranded-DNA-specific exonuclease RecJ, single-stranded-DNA-specific exonuclease [Parcubacteria group bacterium GW2011_GWC1_36_108]KKQ00947.1 MAG: Single-stranded-DNA-specific exonuclease RecJ [Candidatus Moranbacteria bacterium GW2011_GWD1_36_198]KKQ01434.1 MAG: Single-stranded-DNA-specific exonuclease RecJ [Candidatus Moranbacteria bacterium GW2011_GWD2_36_198]KKQ39790.1 MAG: Single-stranded-DNA-specific exonuclease RecJ [Candidatus Moranbacteria bacterium GW2011_GWC2_37_73]HAR
MAKWTLKEPQEISSLPAGGSSLSLNSSVIKLLLSRGLKSEKEISQFIDPNYETDSFDPFAFGDMEKVVDRIKRARDEKQQVAIFGDYDADGITSSAIIKETLDLLGIESFVYIPNKHSEGYGINSAAIDIFKEKNVNLIITVDCGITSIAEVEKANSFGMDVIITDHHHVPASVPDAFAIINPHQDGCGYPFKELAGVGVAFKVVQAVFQKLLPEKIHLSKWMLDLVAIGTIADCVPLVGENRLFVKYGLTVLSKTRRIGLLELFTVGRIVINENEIPDTKKVSFYIAPRINAAGRINHASLAYNLIIEKDVAKARIFALELEANNSERQKITEKIVDEVKVLAENAFKDKKFIFAISEHFSIGVVGLVAGKIVQKYNKPVAIFQKSEDVSKGSFRSIPQINIIETIGECQELLVKYGGHSQAAGVSVANENLEKFYEKMNTLITEKLKGIDLSLEIKLDGELEFDNISPDLVNDLEKLQPFGQDNEEPIFAMRNLIVGEKRTIGTGNKHIKFYFLSKSQPRVDEQSSLRVEAGDSPKIFEAVAFNGYEKYFEISEGDCVDIACNIQKDEWNGNSKIQLMLIDLKVTSL